MNLLTQTGLLFRLRLKLYFGFLRMAPSSGEDRRARLKQLWVPIVMGLAGLMVLGLYFVILSLIMGPAIQAGFGSMVLGLIMLISMLAVLFLGLFSMMASLWGSRDTEMLAALPLSPRAVFFSQMGVVYASQLMLSLFFTLPAVILYALNAPTGFAFWLPALIVLPLLPVLPMMISALLSLSLLRLSALTRRRELWSILGAVVLIVLMMFLQMQWNSLMIGSEMDPAYVEQLLTSNAGLLRAVTGAFPPAAWAAGALTLPTEAMVDFLLFLLSVAAAVLLLLVVAEPLYYRGTLAHLETPRNTKQGYSARDVRQGSPFGTLFWRECRVLLRTPIYLLNSFGVIVILPLVVLLVPTMQISSFGDMSLQDLFSELDKTVLTLAVAGVLTFFALVNPAVTTAMSREGRNFWISRLIPVRMKTVVGAKIMVGELIAVLAVLLSGTALVVGLGLPADCVALAAMMALAVGIPATVAGILPDINRPKLTWTSENEAIKMNVNSLSGMLFSLLVGLGAAGVVWLNVTLGSGMPGIVLQLMGLSILATLFLWNRVQARAEAHLATMDT